MAHYGRSPEEDVLRGEEHPMSIRSTQPRPVMFTRTRDAVESRFPQVSDRRSNTTVPAIFRGGTELFPGLVAKLDVGKRNMLSFIKRF